MDDFVALVDLLPKGLILNHVMLAPSFKANPTHRYEVIENYNNTGQTAVVFRADELELTGVQMDIAYLSVTIDELFTEDRLVNELFVKVGNENFRYSNPVTNDPRLDLDTYSKDITSTAVSKAIELVARKYIKKAGDMYWSPRGIVTESLEKFAYKLVIANNTDAEITGFKVIDVFPHLDDTALVLNQEGVHMPSLSFQSTFD